MTSQVASPASFRPSSFSTRSPHARLHKRGHSSSSAADMVGPRAPGKFSVAMPRSAIATTFAEEDYFGIKSPELTSPVSPTEGRIAGHKFRPHLKRLGNSKESSQGIDLSLSAAENESLAGLGICSVGRQSSDTASRSGYGAGGRHHGRSTSNISQLSTASSLPAPPTALYVHPKRQNPRAYTPPLCTSFHAGSPDFTSPTDPLSSFTDNLTFDYRGQSEYPEHSYRSPSPQSSLASPRVTAFSLKSPPHTAGQSQASLVNSITPPTARGGDKMRSPDVLASSRSSFDKAASIFRARDDSLDPMERKAHIQAARLAYREREEAKERKAEQAMLKQSEKAEKDNERKLKRDEQQRQRVEERAAKKTSLESAAIYNDPEAGPIPPSRRRPSITSKRAALSPWVRFTTWFRIKLHRMRC